MNVKNVDNLSLYKKPYLNSNISFRGVSLGDFEDKEKSDVFDNDSYDGYDITKKFEEGLAAIKLAAKQQRENVYGFFKRRKIDVIDLCEDKEITGFLKAQKITIDEQEKIVELLKRNYEQLKASNAQAERLVEAQTALIMAEKKLEIAKEIAKNKDSHIGFDSIAGYDAEKFILTSSFINLVEEERSGQIVEIPNGILFFGPIGNGKTSFAKAFATSAGCNFEKAKPNSSARTKEAREESFYKDLLEKAKTAQEHFITTGQRTIILADEFDRYANKGSSVVPKLKRFLENCSENYHCTVFATTNNPLDIPAELRSERRMPIKVCLDPPDKINAALVFKHYLKDASNVEMSEINPEKLAEQICSVQPDSSYNNSQIEYICSECITKYDKITQDVILREIENTEPAISNENMNKYRHEKTELVGGFDD